MAQLSFEPPSTYTSRDPVILVHVQDDQGTVSEYCPKEIPTLGLSISLSRDHRPDSSPNSKKRASAHVLEGAASTKRVSLLAHHPTRGRSLSESLAYLAVDRALLTSSNLMISDYSRGDSSGSNSSSPRGSSSSPSLCLFACKDEPQSSTGTDATFLTTRSSSLDSNSSITSFSRASSAPPLSSSSSSPTSLSSPSPITEYAPEIKLAFDTEPTDTEPLSQASMITSPEVDVSLSDRGDGDSAQTTSSINDNNNAQTSLESSEPDLVVTVRDFAYPKSHPYHRGNYPPPPPPPTEEKTLDETAGADLENEDNYYIGAFAQRFQHLLDDEERNNEDPYRHSIVASPEQISEEYYEDRTSRGHARGLYSFEAENSTELSFQEGDLLWVHGPRCQGWLLGEMAGVIGLIPENYVQLL